MKIKKLLSVCLTAGIVFTAPPLADSRTSAATTGINVNYHTQAEINSYISADRYEYLLGGSYGSTYASKPNYSSAPYDMGKLSSTTLNDALEVLNDMRYIAGIDPVSLSSEYNEYAQAASLVNAVNGELTHYPEQPSGMSDALYNKGYTGASSSNIAWGYTAFPDAIVNGWMDDSDDYNIDTLGHRRWCLNPSMDYTGFGMVGTYSAMYALDNPFGSTDYYGVSWPAQNMPLEFFSDNEPWSISMGYSVTKSAVKVTLVRKSDKKQWSFSSVSADGYFNVENSYYGKSGCIIFRPDNITYKAGDSFDVTITGLDTGVHYTVDFFNLTEPETGYFCYINDDGTADTSYVKKVLESSEEFSGVDFTLSAGTPENGTCSIDVISGGEVISTIEAIAGLWGDVNRDGKISAIDTSIIFTESKLIYKNGKGGFNSEKKFFGDANGDGKITASDASLVFTQYKKSYSS